MVKEKLLSKVEEMKRDVEERGSAKLSVCDAHWYGWDKDYWLHRQAIIDKLRKDGYSVHVSVKHGVTDIEVTQEIVL